MWRRKETCPWWSACGLWGIYHDRRIRRVAGAKGEVVDLTRLVEVVDLTRLVEEDATMPDTRLKGRWHRVW